MRKNILYYIKRKVINWFNDMKIRKKLIVTYFTVMSAAILAIGFLSYERINTVLLEQASRNAEYSMMQLNENIKNSLAVYEEISKSIVYNGTLLDYIANIYSNRLDAYEAFKKSIDMINTIKLADSNISNISVYVMNSTFLTDSDLFIKGEVAKQEAWFKKAMDDDSELIWSSPYKDNHGQEVIALRRILFDYKKSFRMTGVLSIEIPQDVIYKYIQAESKNRNIIILNDDGDVITTSNQEYQNKNLKNVSYIHKVFLNDHGKFIQKIGNCKYLIIYNTEYNGWKIVGLMPIGKLSKDSSQLNNFIIIICIITVISLFGITYFIAGRLTRRLNILSEGVRKVGQGKYDFKIFIAGNDEVGQLSTAYNKMTDKLQYMFNEVYGANLRRKEAELKALQAQINPHFLYNVLSSIGWLAMRRGAPEIRKMAMDLAKFYRFSLSKGKNIITLNDEIDQIKTYISIQKVRFGDILNVAYEIDPALGGYKIVKLIVQPVVENSINHGMRGNDIPIHIKIKACSNSDNVIIDVTDDGMGMSQEKVNTILKKGNFSGQSSKCYGIQNVDERIKLNFGNSYGINISSINGVGTTVKIILPPVQATKELPDSAE